MFIEDSPIADGVLLTDCTMRGNTATSGGSAIYANSTEPPELANCLVVGNTGSRAIENVGLPLTMTNSTIWANDGGVSGVGNTIDNCILWGNGSGQNAQVLPGTTPQFSAIQDCTTLCADPADQNIGDDPQFINRLGVDGVAGTEDDILPPISGAPTNDAGDNLAVPVGIDKDLVGNDRLADDPDAENVGNPPGPGLIVDMGAYEYACGPCRLDFDNSADVRVSDLIVLLGCWGPIKPEDLATCVCPDSDGSASGGADGTIRVPDLIALLGAWGACP